MTDIQDQAPTAQPTTSVAPSSYQYRVVISLFSKASDWLVQCIDDRQHGTRIYSPDRHTDTYIS